MGLPYRFGLGLPTNGPFADREGLLRTAVRAEEVGFDDIWTNDFLDFSPSRITRSTAGTYEAAHGQDPNFFEGLTTIAFLAGTVPRIGVGMGGIALPLRDPRLFAKQVATIHELSGRRVTIAPAIGGVEHDFEIMQVPFRMRGRLMDEHLAVLDAIFNGEHPISYDGPHLKFSRAFLYPKPRDLRLWITGETEPAWHRIAKWGSGWLTSYPDPAEYAAKVARMREIVAEAGRDPDTIVTAATVFLCVESTRERAIDVAARSLTDRFGSVEKGLARAIVGSVAEVQDQLSERYALGVRYLELKFLAHDLEAYLEMLARTGQEVLPPLRKLT